MSVCVIVDGPERRFAGSRGPELFSRPRRGVRFWLGWLRLALAVFMAARGRKAEPARPSLFDVSGPATLPGRDAPLPGGPTTPCPASGGRDLFSPKFPGETYRGKQWHMFRAPGGRSVSVLSLYVELGRHVGREARFECPAINFSRQGAGEDDGQLEMHRLVREFAAGRLGCRAEELQSAVTTAWAGEARPVVDFWANGAGHDGHKN